MADEIQQAIQMIQLTGQGIGVSIRVMTVSAQVVMAAIKALSESGVWLKRRFVSNERSFQSFNQFASEHGIQLTEEPIADRDVRNVKRLLTKYGVDFSVVRDQNGEHRLYIKAANEPTLRLALEQVIAAHERAGQNALPEQTQTEQSSELSASEPAALPEPEAQPPQPKPYYNITMEQADADPKIGLKQFFDSHQETVDCANALNKGLELAQTEGRLPQFLSEQCRQYGPERVKAVLVRSVQIKDRDGRISQENRAYAASFQLLNAGTEAHDDMTREYNLGVHPGILNLAVSDFRAIEAEQNRERSAAVTIGDTPHDPQTHQPPPPEIPEERAAAQNMTESEQEVQTPNQKELLQPKRFDDLLAEATAKAKEANAARRAAERTGERTTERIPEKTPKLVR